MLNVLRTWLSNILKDVHDGRHMDHTSAWVDLFMRELVAAETVLFVSGTDVSAMSVCHLDLEGPSGT